MDGDGQSQSQHSLAMHQAIVGLVHRGGFCVSYVVLVIDIPLRSARCWVRSWTERKLHSGHQSSVKQEHQAPMTFDVDCPKTSNGGFSDFWGQF